MDSKIRAVWAYQNLPEHHDREYRWFLFIASVLSFKKFAPALERVVYLDKASKKKLEQYKALDLFDVVEDIEFREILPKMGNTYWAAPQNYVQTLQTVPFFILDSDIVLQGPIDEWFSPDEYYVYDHVNRLDTYNTAYREGDKEWYSKVSLEKPGLGLIATPGDMIDGGFVYYPDPKIGAMLGYMLLGIQSDMTSNFNREKFGEDKYWWNIGTIAEEACYNSFLRLAAKTRINNMWEEPYSLLVVQYFDKNRPIDEYAETVKHIQEVLGYDIRSKHNI